MSSRKVTQKRHIAKTISWRLVGSLDTFIISWIISGNPFTGFKISIAEVFTKMLLYYLHERVWSKIHLNKKLEKSSETRHVIKAVTWRIIGTIDTMFLAWIISGNPLVGLKVGVVEVFTKMALYYLHERVWYKSNFGIEEEQEIKKEDK